MSDINKTTRNIKKLNEPIKMAEPKHRISLQGVTSGISIRQYPKNIVQKVREICFHYVKKTSGKYEDNKAAARYVHQMADEVLGQIGGVALQLKKYERDPESYQALLNEWNDNFPASLGALGTPKAIADKVEQQKHEISHLRNELEVEKYAHKNDVQDVLRSMESQVRASRDGVMSERG